MSEQFLKTIKSRCVMRAISDAPVEPEELEKILETARWAPAAGNQRSNRLVVIQDPLVLRLVRMFSPGMFQKPPVVILLCIDWAVVKANQFSDMDMTPFVDVGASMQTIMLAAHGIGLGSGPVTSFSKEALRVILNLPPNLTPEVEICVGYPAPPTESQLPMKRKKKVTWQSLVDWGRYEDS
jgi:nitroreductase